MKIAILTSGILPVPAVQGGAVENLIDFYLEYNESHHLHDITVYSVWHPEVARHPALNSKVNHYRFVKTKSYLGRLQKLLYQKTHQEGYYHGSIEFFLHESIRHLKRQDYDIILLENRPGYALKIRQVTKALIVCHLHNENLTSSVPQCKAIYEAADGIITVSDYIKSCVLTINPNDSKTVSVYNGINLNAFSRPAIKIDSRMPGLNVQDFVLIYSGRINEEKGIMQLIEAMNLLRDYPAIKLLVIGSSFFGNDNTENDFIQRLKQLARPLGDRIIFTGYVPYAKMPDYLSMADVAVIPSVWDDPFPTTVLEAQAMGLPIISTRRGGIPEEVTPETAILLNTDAQFISSLANAILDLYHHPEKRQSMGKAGLERSELFSKERYAKEFFEALEKITHAYAPAPHPHRSSS